MLARCRHKTLSIKGQVHAVNEMSQQRKKKKKKNS